MNQDAYEVDNPVAKAQQEIRDLIAAEELPREGVGAAAEGLVRVTAQNGRLAEVSLDSKAMRMATAELAQAIAEAANAALTDLESKYPELAVPTVDLAALEAEVAEAQETGSRQMRRYLESIADAQSGR